MITCPLASVMMLRASDLVYTQTFAVFPFTFTSLGVILPQLTLSLQELHLYLIIYDDFVPVLCVVICNPLYKGHYHCQPGTIIIIMTNYLVTVRKHHSS
ncbi:hypothetical protein E2C01_051491 [Portunus trituberculatus]|uniref:Uncharacterized protein n=1 Tax=Portunus trituberculatus TaxID=210409 RepID=A0A5B7GB46_PORTR|nr:hypothetical protein [Portunus trituberculatus]